MQTTRRPVFLRSYPGPAVRPARLRVPMPKGLPMPQLTDLAVRRAVSLDADQVLEVAQLNGCVWIGSRESVRSIRDNDDLALIVAVLPPPVVPFYQVIGYALVGKEGDGLAGLYSIQVHPSSQGRGVGRLLARYVRNAAHQFGRRQVVAYTHQLGAAEFLFRCGWTLARPASEGMIRCQAKATAEV